MGKVWRIAPHDEGCVRELSRGLRISPLLAQVLLSRGYATCDDARAFLGTKLTDLHDPELLPGISQAADRLVAAIRSGRRITIYGDYDVDGVTATSLLWHCLKLAGANVDYYIPHRLEEGYGLNCDALRQLYDEDPRRLVVSVDCGITSCTEAALANDLGLELIVTDHHQFAEQLPAATVVVHPRLPGTYPFGDLCGAGVAFKLAWAICARLGDGKRASPRMREFLLSAVGLTAIGTVADVVPLIGENRILVRYGLASLIERSNAGLKALLQIAGLDGNREFQAEDIGYALAPRINAAGRLGQARLAVELLTTDNPERATALADYLDELNRNRQTVERRMFKEAKELVAENPHWENDHALVLAHHEWHAGVIGIVANRVAEHFQKPTVLIALNRQTRIGQGSARTFAGFNLHAGLAACGRHLETFGGHHAAAGLKISADGIEAFREEFSRYVRENHQARESDGELRIDAEVRLADVSHRAVFELDQLGPFGSSNPRPIFAASSVELAETPRKMGQGEQHLSLKVRQFGTVLRAIAFGRGEWADRIAAQQVPFSICFQPIINRFRGQENVELQLIDWQPAAAVSAAS